MRFFRIAAVLLLFLGLFSNGSAQSIVNIIPMPAHMDEGRGMFAITKNTRIVKPTGLFANETAQLNNLLAKGLGSPLNVSSTPVENAIELRHDASMIGAEAYKLVITSNKIIISASGSAGIFHAIETIRQLLPAGIEKGRKFPQLELPSLSIDDAPAYSWRGMHLDVSRHFFSIAYLHKFVDIMALYKMNKLHLHLTDDEGWRIEIKKYPKLTEQSAWRTFDRNDSSAMRRSVDNPDFTIDPEHIIHRDGKTLYGGYYTQQQMKDFVAYAAKRHIDVIPEIDMPGHMMAAINAYPFLTCNGKNSRGELFTKPICPCNESTFEFAENVFKEIMDIFPSKYIHIGGDEVDRSDWAKSPACKALMEREGIKDLPALQSYFINRMEKFFNAHGRKMIGWDEIIEGGVTPSAIVMYWRTWVPSAPVKAAKNGNTVIMAPGEPLYFDNPADQYSIYKIYHFNPIPAGLTKREEKAIIGAQAQLWSENITSENRADYMFMPRMTALSELLWTNNQADYDSYHNRLTAQYPRLDNLNVHYRLPDLPGMISENVFTDKDTLEVKKPLPQMRIFYTTDGSLPTTKSKELIRPLVISESQHIRLAAFMPQGLRGDIYSLNYTKEKYADAVKPGNTAGGLAASYYKDYFKNTKGMAGKKADSTFTSDNVAVPASVKAPSFGMQYRGYINVPADGVYSFYLTCDDGGILKIGDKLVIDNDGQHSAQERNGQVALRKGLHPFAVDFIEGGGGFTLQLKYSFKGSMPVNVPSSWFTH